MLKNRLKKEGNRSVTNCNQLKLKAADGKFYKTDVADQEQLFRLIQSIPSPKAEPFKVWMSKIVSRRAAAAWRRTHDLNSNARRDARSFRRSMRQTPAHWKSISATLRLCPRLDAARRDVVADAAIQTVEKKRRNK